MSKIPTKILSGVFQIQPKEMITLFAKGSQSGQKYGMVRLTPRKTYRAFKSDFQIAGGRNTTCIIVIKDGYRWFPLDPAYAKEKFNYTHAEPLQFGPFITDFNSNNEHIRNTSETLKLYQ